MATMEERIERAARVLGKPVLPSLSELRSADARVSRRDFVEVARLLALGARLSDIDGMPSLRPKLKEIAKAVVSGGTIGSSDLVGDFNTLSQAFIASLANVGVFDFVLSNGRSVPWQVYIAAATAIASGPTGEGKAKQIRALLMNAGDMTRAKGTATVVFSRELLRAAGPAAERFVENELRVATIRSVDEIFLSALATPLTPIAGSASVATDLKAMLDQTNTSADSVILLAVNPLLLNSLLLQQNPAAASGLTTSGGQFAGVRVLPSDALATGTAMMLDAQGIVVSDQGLQLTSSQQASLEMFDTPTMEADSPPTAGNLVSLWQTNSTALRTERRIAFAKARASAAAIVTGATWAP